jgi:hypothetical protein
MRGPRWRYIVWSDGSTELYDHDRDPEEWRNVATDPTNATTLANLNATLESRR